MMPIPSSASLTISYGPPSAGAAASPAATGLTAYLTVNNLLDEDLSLGNDLNPQFGGRYFQPAPGREVLVGVRWVLRE